MTMPVHSLKAKILSEGYCCLYGYLALCRERGETVINMAKHINISPDALWYHYRKLDDINSKEPKCHRYKECLDPIVQELLTEKTKGP